jgi:hypothetical protein
MKVANKILQYQEKAKRMLSLYDCRATNITIRTEAPFVNALSLAKRLLVNHVTLYPNDKVVGFRSGHFEGTTEKTRRGDYIVRIYRSKRPAGL